MAVLTKVTIGFVLTSGFRPADVVETDAIFRFHPRNKIYYVSAEEGFVKGKSDMELMANTSFEECPDLDVLVVGEMDPTMEDNTDLLNFIHKQSTGAKYIIGISNGVWSLHKAGVLDGKQVTADRSTIKRLLADGVPVINERRSVRDGKVFTSGPSSGGIESAFAVMKEIRGEWITKLAEFNLEYNAHVQYPLAEKIEMQQPELPKKLHVGIFADDGLYVPDVMGALDVFGSIPNVEFHYLAHREGLSKSVIGFGPSIYANTTFDKCPQLDVLIVGATHPKYVNDSGVLDFILKQEEELSAIISVCAGTFVVGSTGLLEGKDAATNYHQVVDLPRIGVCPTGNEIAVDGKYFSAGPAVGSYEVGLKAVEKIVGREWAQYIEHEKLEFAPKPLFGLTEENAGKSIMRVTNVLSFAVRRLYRPKIRKGYYGQSDKQQAKEPITA